MQSVRRLPLQARAAARQFSRQQPRRYAHDAHGAHDVPPAPENESFGKGFFLALAGVPLAVLAINYTTGSEDLSYFSRLIQSYSTSAERLDKSNDLHTKAVELAADDRALFLNGTPDRAPRHIELRNVEALSGGSPFNVPAGQGSADMSGFIAKYEKINYDENARKLKALKDGTLKAEQPFQGRSPART